MGELIQFPKPKGDISDTPLGERLIRDIAKPAFQQCIEAAEVTSGFESGIDLDAGEWAVIPLDESE